MNVRDAELRMAEVAREDDERAALVAFANDVISWADATGTFFPERLYQRATAIVDAHEGTPPATGRAEPGAPHAARGRALPLPAPTPAACHAEDSR
jgi:hypothetical protein